VLVETITGENESHMNVVSNERISTQQVSNKCGLKNKRKSRHFLVLRRIFARIFPNLPEKFFCGFAYKFSPAKIMKIFFWYEHHKKVFMSFSAKVGRHFFPDFRRLRTDFQGFCPDFRQIKTLGCA